MSTVFTVFRKELVDALRDRRTVFIALVMGPLLFPLLFMGLGSFAAKKQSEKLEKPLELPVVGAEHAPNLVAWLKAEGVVVLPAPRDADAAVRAQDHPVILAIPDTYPAQWRRSEPARLDLVLDSSRALESGAAVARLERLLASYDREVGTLRLVARGVHPALASPLAVARRDLATPESKAGLQLMMMPYLLILLGFIGGMHLAIDSTAGERERQSLEPLLATPVSRTAIMSGKLAATVVFALMTLTLTFVTFKLSTLVGSASKMSFDISAGASAQLFLVLLPVVAFGSALLTLLAANAKSYREAQSYLSVVFLLPMIPTMLLMINPVKTKLWMLAVPFLGQNQMITKILRGESPGAIEWLVVLGAGFLLAALFWAITARLYHREQLAISA
jgi:sodium transport system permease protein